jgi:ABC-2 type transport system ATP-binding protein
MTISIRVENVSLTYKVLMNRTGSLKELFRDTVKGRVRLLNFSALEGISFDVNKGEVIAILGRNGSGKSTLLKILAQVLPASSGKVEVIGSIAPMIELGAGFHNELTGAENVLFFSALLGRDTKNVKSRIPAIGEWAGVTDHMNFPLRTFSSGMIARLAFSTATDEVAEILLVDEILSVGDGDFQRKSRLRMEQMIASGSTVVIVSHDMETVRKLAGRAIWLEKGRIKAIGPANTVVDKYEKSATNN